VANKAMIAVDDTSFFYHLGDIIYMGKGSGVTTNSAVPKGDSAEVEFYEDGGGDDGEFGYRKVTIKARTLSVKFIGADSGKDPGSF
jgi:hypothetical protein